MENDSSAETALEMPIGFVFCRDGLDVDALLADFARSLRMAGVRVGGIVQHKGHGPDGDPTMVVEDLVTGDTINISQDLGSGSTACHIDPAGMVAAGLVVRRAIDDGNDLVVINRFGKLESTGSGLLSEFLYAATEAVPVLTAVARTMAEPWAAFTGGYGSPIAPDLDSLHAWWRSVTSIAPRGSAERSDACGYDLA